MKGIHFICAKEEESSGNRGLRPIDFENNIWISGYWYLKPENLKELIGGFIFLHRAQAKKSFFGGKVLEIIPVEREELKRSDRVDIKFTLDDSARGVPWSEVGKKGARVHTSGLVDIN
ncbi:hypothetical protein OA512_01535 [SAR86 cluster bacterium]|nr:hypothetical protein [SAR86 cluster bacterium]